MNGVIVLNKSPGITSAKALYRVRAITGQRKSGHAGTLDPAAGGVLVLCLGRATKLVERIMNLPKTYRAAARLDVTSASFDADAPLAPAPVGRVPTGDEVAAAFASFVGWIEQTPPAVSAVKVGGTPAYKRVRRGEAVTLSPRPVRIDEIHILSFDWPHLEFEMRCGRGTYVRSLIRDVGLRLGTGGCLTGLTRTAVGPFTFEAACTFAELESGRWQSRLIPLEEAIRLLGG